MAGYVGRGEVTACCEQRLTARSRQSVYCTVSEVELRPVPHPLSKTPERSYRQSRLGFVKWGHLAHQLGHELVQQANRALTESRPKDHAGFQ